jgi:hypothetical protein
MPPDPRILELLERYPDQLTDAELAELRAAGEQDPEVEELMDALHDVDGLLCDVPPVELSEAGEARLDRLVQESKGWSTGGSTPASQATDAAQATGAEAQESKGWSTGGSTPASKVVDLGAARRRHWLLAHPTATALAALMLLAAGFMIRDQLTPPQEFTFRGDDDVSDPDRIDGELHIMGETRLLDGATRAVDRPITFRALMQQPAALVLVETQAGRSFVLWPEPGLSWQVSSGVNLVQPSGLASTYAPAGPGEATYTLLASRPEAPIPVPPSRQTASPAALVEGQEGTSVLGRITIRWEATR